MRDFLIFSLISLFVFSCDAQQKKSPVHAGNLEKTTKIRVISTQEFKSKLKENVQLIDVRTPSEFSEGYISNAENINLMNSDFEDEIENLDKEKPVYIYCRSGQRSNKAAKKMIELGFKEIYDLEGGITSWEKHGENVERNK